MSDLKNNRKKWLPHLETSIPESARGYTVSMYSIALEGWRRGLSLKFINRNRRKSEVFYSLSNEEREHVFTVSRGDKVSMNALRICRNKHLTKEYLTKAGVPTPEGELFQKEIQDDKIVEYAKSLGFPLVIKPVDGTGGTGVIANIQNVEEFKSALKYVRHDLNRKEVIVERHFDGRGYRIYVIGDEVIGAFDRIPANVIGDGQNNIKTLLKQKISERDKNPALFKRPITIDDEMHNMLKSIGYDLNSVPAKGERVILKTKNNVSSGGDSIDVTDKMTAEIKEMAVNAVRAVPELVHAGLDLIVDEENNTGVILEINSMPSIRNHLFPNEGEARDVAKAIVDFYFPETISIDTTSHPLYYFNYEHVFNNFQNGYAKEITIPNIPDGELSTTKYKVTGSFKNLRYGRWVRRQARNLNLNGFINIIGQDDAEIIVSGSEKSIKRFELIINNDSPQYARIKNIVKDNYKLPIQIGFEITQKKEGYYPVHLKDPARKKSTKRQSKNRARKTKNNNYYKKKYNEVLNSTSWKITKPVRVFGKILKKILN